MPKLSLKIGSWRNASCIYEDVEPPLIQLVVQFVSNGLGINAFVADKQTPLATQEAKAFKHQIGKTFAGFPMAVPLQRINVFKEKRQLSSCILKVRYHWNDRNRVIEEFG
jgi:hypothetical protein